MVTAAAAATATATEVQAYEHEVVVGLPSLVPLPAASAANAAESEITQGLEQCQQNSGSGNNSSDSII